VDGPDFEVWERRCDELCLFDAPLGSNGAIHSDWSRPAAELGLPLLARMYADGLDVSGQELMTLREEVDALTRHWLDTVDSDETITYSLVGSREARVQVPLIVDLLRRADDLRSAIRIAQRVDGFLTIG